MALEHSARAVSHVGAGGTDFSSGINSGGRLFDVIVRMQGLQVVELLGDELGS